MLHNLKEAPVIKMVGPFTGAVLCKHRVAEHRDGGPRFNTIRPLLRQPAGLNLHHSGIIPASLYWLTPSALFILRAVACIADRLCCRVAVKLHQTINFQTLHQCLCVTLTAQSGKVTHASPFDLHQKTQLRQLMAGL